MKQTLQEQQRNLNGLIQDGRVLGFSPTLISEYERQYKNLSVKVEEERRHNEALRNG